MAISSINFKQNISFCIPSADEEEKQIIAKLLAYGITPTGNKSVDRAKLHDIELKQAKTENCISNKFLTVSIAEQEKIKEQKEFSQNIPKSSTVNINTFEGSVALGEQIYLAIKMKNKK